MLGSRAKDTCTRVEQWCHVSATLHVVHRLVRIWDVSAYRTSFDGYHLAPLLGIHHYFVADSSAVNFIPSGRQCILIFLPNLVVTFTL